MNKYTIDFTTIPDNEFCVELVGLDKVGKIFNNELNMIYEILLQYREKFNSQLLIKIIYNGKEYYM